jgi:hypothetical protein
MMDDRHFIYHKCGECLSYSSGRKLKYPNADPEKDTWRRCGIGSTVKHDSMACEFFESDPLV